MTVFLPGLFFIIFLRNRNNNKLAHKLWINTSSLALAQTDQILAAEEFVLHKNTDSYF